MRGKSPELSLRESKNIFVGERHTLSDGGKGKKKAELFDLCQKVVATKQVKLAASAEGGEVTNK